MVSSILALVGVVQSSVLLRYLHHHMHLELEPLQTAMFMQLVIAGHLLLFSTRAGRFFFEPPFPEWKFFCAIMGTQLLAALMAANGWLLTPISWELIGFIWVYNLVWLVVIDAMDGEAEKAVAFLFRQVEAEHDDVSPCHRKNTQVLIFLEFTHDGPPREMDV